MQNDGGRLATGSRQRGPHPRLVRGERRDTAPRSRRATGDWSGAEVRKRAQAADDEVRDVLAVGREQLLAVDLHVEPRLVGERLQLALDVVRHPLLDHEHAALAAQEPDQLLGNQRVDAR